MNALLALLTGVLLAVDVPVADPPVVSGPVAAADTPVREVSVRAGTGVTEVVITVDGRPDVRDFTMEGPNRLVLDLMGATHALPRRDFFGIDRGGVIAVRTSQYSSEIVRVVVELDQLVDYRIERSEGQLRVILDSSGGRFATWSTSTHGPAETAEAGGASARAAPPSTEPTASVAAPAGTAAVPIASRRGVNPVRAAATPMPGPESTGVSSGAREIDGVMVSAAIDPAELTRTELNALRGPAVDAPSPDVVATSLMRRNPRGLLQEPGERITVTFTETPLANVLFTFAEFSGRSIVPGSQVGGTVDADIRDQPWDVALRAILEARGLVAQETESGIIRVDNVANLAEQEQVEPVVTRPFRINYATAQEIQQAIQPLLSERGSISVGSGTNSIIVTDLPRVVGNIESLLQDLDVRTPQIQISAKIIFVNRTDLREMGIVYDLKDTEGNQLNTILPGFIDANGDGQVNPGEEVEVGTDVVSITGSSIAALGNANQTVSSPSLLALTTLTLGRFTLLNFIQALEELSMTDIQAAPTLTVLDNHQARVQVGEETPLRVVDFGAAGGGEGSAIPQANVQFRETGIILEVTPHVTADENILLELHAERSDAELASSDIGFVFNTQEADSRVLVRDGETVVIAGLTVTEETEARAGIPFLMNLPGIGRFFRLTRNERTQQDLMILVTPHIVRETLN